MSAVVDNLRASITLALVVCVVLCAPLEAAAAVPPLKIAAARLASVREQAKSLKVDVEVTITAGAIRDFAADDAGLLSGKPLDLTRRGESKKKLTIGPDAPLPWKAVHLVIGSPNPASDLQKHLGKLDASTDIDTLGDAFVYVYGSSPRLVVSRTLGAVRAIAVESEKYTWQLKTSGSLGTAGLPERIHILRSGQPYATVQLELAKAAD